MLPPRVVIADLFRATCLISMLAVSFALLSSKGVTGFGFGQAFAYLFMTLVISVFVAGVVAVCLLTLDKVFNIALHYINRLIDRWEDTDEENEKSIV